jgi:hypothetical protein
MPVNVVPAKKWRDLAVFVLPFGLVAQTRNKRDKGPFFGGILVGRGLASDSLRSKTQQGHQPCLGFCASHLILLSPRHVLREFCRASLTFSDFVLTHAD